MSRLNRPGGRAARGGRVLMEVLVSMLILGAFLAAIGDTYRQGSEVRRRVAAEEAARRVVANRLAARRAEIATGSRAPGRVPIEQVPDLLPGMECAVQTLVTDAGGGLVQLELVASWRLAAHQGVERRRLLVPAGGGR